MNKPITTSEDRKVLMAKAIKEVTEDFCPIAEREYRRYYAIRCKISIEEYMKAGFTFEQAIQLFKAL